MTNTSMTFTRQSRAFFVLLIAGLLAGVLAFANPAPATSDSGPDNMHARHIASQSIGLAWTGSSDRAYRVRFSEDAGMSSTVTWDVVGNYLEWNSLKPNPTHDGARLNPGSTYYFQVREIKRMPDVSNRNVLSAYTRPVAITLPADGYPELEPTSVKATAAGADAMYVSWKTRGPGLNYVVRYSDDANKPLAEWSTAKFDVAGGIVEGLSPNRRYHFRVQVRGENNEPLSEYSAAISAVTQTKTNSPAISVVSYNIMKSAASPAWTSRRDAVAKNIRRHNPDVIGLQEATPAKVTAANGKKVPQYTDILQRLGSQYKFTTTKGSNGSKLVYNTKTMKVVKSGTKKLKKKGAQRRYAVWAVLKDKRSQKKFFVANTHLEPGSSSSKAYNDVRIKQAKQVAALAKKYGKGLPVIIVGDMNSNRFHKPSNGQYGVFTKAGYLDPTDNAVGNWESGLNARAEHLIDIEYNGYNGFASKPAITAFPVGTYISYMYASASVRVAMWRNVVDVDRNRKFRGIIPSDHNLLWMSVHLA